MNGDSKNTERFLLIVASKTYKIKSIAEECNFNRSSLSEFKRSGYLSEEKISRLRNWFIKNEFWSKHISFEGSYRFLSEYIMLLNKVCRAVRVNDIDFKSPDFTNKIISDMQSFFYSKNDENIANLLYVNEVELAENLKETYTCIKQSSKDEIKVIIRLYIQICIEFEIDEPLFLLKKFSKNGSYIPKWMPLFSDEELFNYFLCQSNIDPNRLIETDVIEDEIEICEKNLVQTDIPESRINNPFKIKDDILKYLHEHNYADKAYEIKLAETFLDSAVRCDFICNSCGGKTPSAGSKCMYCGSSLRKENFSISESFRLFEALKRNLIESYSKQIYAGTACVESA